MNDLARLLHEATGEGECIWFETGGPLGFINGVALACCCGKTTTWSQDRWESYWTGRIRANSVIKREERRCSAVSNNKTSKLKSE